MARLPRWVVIGGALLVVLMARWLDERRPFPPVLRAKESRRQ